MNTTPLIAWGRLPIQFIFIGDGPLNKNIKDFKKKKITNWMTKYLKDQRILKLNKLEKTKNFLKCRQSTPKNYGR